MSKGTNAAGNGGSHGIAGTLAMLPLAKTPAAAIAEDLNRPYAAPSPTGARMGSAQ
ncbi:MAG: hypothetical protein ACR2LX_12500 [Jatrophihabitans sp.]